MDLTVEGVRVRQALGLFRPEWEERKKFPVEEYLAEESCDVHAEVVRGSRFVCVECGVGPCESTVDGQAFVHGQPPPQQIVPSAGLSPGRIIFCSVES